ncbi:peptidase M1 [Flavipsychrobacter stenotrophus]|uniref:Peptidase M1 n=1 Tax=Flavipsychrobacter stenotrophus TaxID=2077091 RepID=A0A2S7T127_9BACT|nr:M1 family metallopeptidase [Flavipsychrobacter stenotrophus]PQJ12456.1 peptidase M1 [Flavipsychrobacter stenotrophus]
MKKVLLIILSMWYLLSANTTFAFAHADTLRGSNGRGRDWWDVKKYWLQVSFDTARQSIKGFSDIEFSVVKTARDSMQIDLQDPMVVDSVILIEEYTDSTNRDRIDALLSKRPARPGLKVDPIYTTYIHRDRTLLSVKKENNVWWVISDFSKLNKKDPDSLRSRSLMVYFHGSPRKAVNPPWDGGFSWKHDSTGKPWIAVSCQGLGASVWWPCKDAQWDEPDNGMDICLDVPRGLAAISNGRFVDTSKADIPGYLSWTWKVKNPINNYDVSFYIGDYVHWHDTLEGENTEDGELNLDFWVLRYNEDRARKQFAVVPQMIHCFEYWMGPYPFYEDGYKLVEAPYLGMEHQSAVAYGNKYKMGYMGFDRTGTDIGMKFDYIIIHESGHEWFGNSVTAKDMADNWIHEGITTYSESLFAECLLGKEKGQAYCRGEWRNIDNDKPMIGPYGVNEEGSNDIYDKGAAIMHMIRVLANGDDEKFRQILRGLSKNFYHQTVTTQQVEAYIATRTGLDLTAFFNQYLRQANIPKLEYKIKHKKLTYKFTGVVSGFTLPIPITDGNTTITINPTDKSQTVKWKGKNVEFSKDFLMNIKKKAIN